MISPFVVERVSEDNLSRVIYRFYCSDLVTYLDEIIEESRPTRRHGWKGQTVYSRLYFYRGTSNTQSSARVEPEVPEDVISEAVALIRSRVAFKKWSEQR
jgi:hypothetical protein